MLGTLAIALLDQWVVTEPVGFGDSRLEIVDDNHLRGATEELESVAVEYDPACYTLIENELDEHMAAEREGHYEVPGFAQLSGSLVK